MVLKQGYDSSICILLFPLFKVAYCTVSTWVIIDSTLALQITINERRIWETVNIHLSNPKLEVDPVHPHHQGTNYLYFLRELYLKYITWKVKLLSCVWLFATTWTVAYQAPQSTEFSRQEYWSGLPFPSPGRQQMYKTRAFPQKLQSTWRKEMRDELISRC